VQKSTPHAAPTIEPTSLANVVKVFNKWLALSDTAPLYALLGTLAANLLSGDPVWLGIIAPPSSAKTELLNALSKLPYVVSAEALSPAALLSGTSKRQKAKTATGGLLMQLGDFGVLAFKDFGTVLEMRIEARSEMLAALRRVFEGVIAGLVAFVAGVLGVGYLHLPPPIVATEAGAFLVSALAGFAGVSVLETLGAKKPVAV